MKLAVIGAGGHAKVVIESARAAGWEVIGTADSRADAAVPGVPSLGDPQQLRLAPDTALVIAIGANAVRERIAQQLGERRWATIIHPSATVSASAVIGRGTVVMAGAIIQAATVVGGHVIINTGARVDHDNHIADFAHIAPGAVLTGNVTVLDGALVGAGAVVTPGVILGEWSTLGAGAVAIHGIPNRETWAGVPARALRGRNDAD